MRSKPLRNTCERVHFFSKGKVARCRPATLLKIISSTGIFPIILTVVAKHLFFVGRGGGETFFQHIKEYLKATTYHFDILFI